MVLRRRLALYIAQWCSIKLAAEHRPGLYDVMAQLMSRSESLIVRLSAARATRARTLESQLHHGDSSTWLT